MKVIVNRRKRFNFTVNQSEFVICPDFEADAFVHVEDDSGYYNLLFDRRELMRFRDAIDDFIEETKYEQVIGEE